MDYVLGLCKSTVQTNLWHFVQSEQKCFLNYFSVVGNNSAIIKSECCTCFYAVPSVVSMLCLGPSFIQGEYIVFI